MADKQISGLTVATALDGTEESHILQGANSRRVSMDNIAARSGFARVRVVATANVALATELEDGDTLDGVTLVKGDWVLLAAQTSAPECGVYVVVAAAAGAASRATAFSLYNQLVGAYFSVMEGTAKADTLWHCTSNKGGTIDTTALVISEFTSGATPIESLIVAPSDETTALTAGTGKTTFRMPYGFSLSAVRASLTTAQTSGTILTVDINEAGVSILSTKLTIDNTEKTSTTAATAAVISDAALADDAEMTVDIDQVGDGTAKGLKVTLIGTRT